MRSIEDIESDFELLDEWEDRYRYLIELGRELEPMPDADKNEATKVRGCVSQVWVTSESDRSSPPIMAYRGESDAHIVRGLVAIALALYSGRPAPQVIETDAQAVFERLGLAEHLTPQRSNGFRSLVSRMQDDARSAMAAAA